MITVEGLTFRGSMTRLGGIVENYLAEISRLPLLDRQKERELAARSAQGDREAAQKLAQSQLRLVVKIAHEYTRAHGNLLDLVQEGNLGLLHAVEKFDVSRNVKLSTYASWWIRAYILRYLLQNARIVRLGTTPAQRKLFFNLRKEQAKLERIGITPSSEAVAKAMHLPVEEVRSMQQRMDRPDLSLDAPLDENDGGERNGLDLLESPGALRPDVAAESHELRTRLRQRLAAFGKTLDGRERILFRDRLMSPRPKTLEEVGAKFGVSRERARQVETQLRERLKDYLRAELGDAVDATLAA
jgi:RNA polymerase sigma-32 factor